MDQTNNSAQETTSIIEMARGAVIERIDLEMYKIMENIQDLNTEPSKARQLTVKVTMKPDNNRENIKVSYQVQSSLARQHPSKPACSLVSTRARFMPWKMSHRSPGRWP